MATCVSPHQQNRNKNCAAKLTTLGARSWESEGERQARLQLDRAKKTRTRERDDEGRALKHVVSNDTSTAVGSSPAAAQNVQAQALTDELPTSQPRPVIAVS